MDHQLKLIKDFSVVLVQVETRTSPAEVERTRITDLETKELIKFNNAIGRRV